MSETEAKKERAAKEAVREVRSGQVLGLGTGSTSRYAVISIGERFRSGELTDIKGVPTSEATAQLATEYGIPLLPWRDAEVDLAIDGADEVDPNLDMIKGLGGALLREKAVEIGATRFVVVVDDQKLVSKLGTKSPLPIEVSPSGWERAADMLAKLGCTPVLRKDQASGAPKMTDQANYLVDCRFPNGIDDPHALAAALDRMPDVIAHGLFLDMADVVVVASEGAAKRMDRPRPKARR